MGGALFPPWTNTAFRVGLIVLVLGASAALVVPMVYARSPFATGSHAPLVQPIAFDHRHHVKDDGIDCLYCHENAERGPYAGVPDTARCMGCHAQIWNDSVTLAPLRASAETGQPIRWQRVHSLPDFVYFDHSIHVTRGIGCVTCHGNVDEMAAVYQVEPLSMHWCVDCHRDPTPHLRPRDQITSTSWRPTTAVLSELAAAYEPRVLTSCSACHR
ncbi:MAG: cytochrome c3 family protein [Kofleriaceae bacterium]